MTRTEILRIIEKKKLIAVLRLNSVENLLPVTEALLKGGVSIIEFTMTIPGILSHLTLLRKNLGSNALIGMGSVLTAEAVPEITTAGAQFIVSPVMKPEIIKAAHQQGVPAMIGAYTPTEILDAADSGSDLVKVFPANKLGPAYIKAVKAPMPHLRLMPTGGVDLENIHDWLEAGAFALGAGSSLVDVKAAEAGQYEKITQRAKLFSDAVASFKASSEKQTE